MFLEKVIERNPELIHCAFDLHRKGLILPDTYILDLDRITENGRKMKAEADRYGIDLYFMLKQIGRNPLVAGRLMDLGLGSNHCRLQRSLMHDRKWNPYRQCRTSGTDS